MAVQSPKGEMLWFNEDKGHGYIRTADGERLYVDGAAFAAGPPVGPCAGLHVDFDVAVTPDGRQAVAARIVPEVAPRRARRRRSM